MAIKYIDQLNLNGKKVIIRVDYNVPYDKKMNITDDERIRATLPTIEHCIKNNAVTVLISHLGRPKGKIVPEMSLKPVADRLSELINKKVLFIDSPIDASLKDKISGLKPSDIVLLENIRFYPQEEKNDDDFGRLLAGLGDIYINDAFAAAHRGHASNEAVTRYAKECAAGFLLKNEIEYFKKALLEPEKPLTAIIGGAKVSTKINALLNIIDRVDSLLIGGAMAFTFLRAKGIETGKSLVEADFIDSAVRIIDKAEKNNVKILLPVDFVIADQIDEKAKSDIADAEKIPVNMMGLDIGPKTINNFKEVINKSKTIVWNGPMGVFEIPAFAMGTNEIARIIAETPCLSIIGGGDSVSAIKKSGFEDKVSYISTGGGAFLELLEGKTLPAIAALDK